MITAKFEKVPLAVVREILPAGSSIPDWSIFTVNIEVTAHSASIRLFDRYYFEVTKTEAFNAMDFLNS